MPFLHLVKVQGHTCVGEKLEGVVFKHFKYITAFVHLCTSTCLLIYPSFQEDATCGLNNVLIMTCSYLARFLLWERAHMLIPRNGCCMHSRYTALNLYGLSYFCSQPFINLSSVWSGHSQCAWKPVHVASVSLLCTIANQVLQCPPWDMQPQMNY